MGKLPGLAIAAVSALLLDGCALDVAVPSCVVRTHPINSYGARLWMRLNELTGLTVYDSSVSGYTGTVAAAGPSLSAVGPQTGGRAVQFTGASGSGITAIGTTSSFEFVHSTLKYTIAFWSKQLDVTDPTLTVPLSSGNGTGGSRGFYIVWNAPSKYYYICFNYMGGGGCFFDSNNAITDNEWHHFAITMDGSIAKYYIDGAIRTTFPAASFSGAAGASTSPLMIGTLAGVPAYEFRGRIDDVAIFARELSATEIATVYAKSRDCP